MRAPQKKFRNPPTFTRVPQFVPGIFTAFWVGVQPKNGNLPHSCAYFSLALGAILGGLKNNSPHAKSVGLGGRLFLEAARGTKTSTTHQVGVSPNFPGRRAPHFPPHHGGTRKAKNPRALAGVWAGPNLCGRICERRLDIGSGFPQFKAIFPDLA